MKQIYKKKILFLVSAILCVSSALGQINDTYQKNSVQHKYPNISKSGISRKITSSNYLLTLHNKKMINKLLSSYEKELSLREI